MLPNLDNPASSLAPMPPGSALPCCLTEEQGQRSLTPSGPAHLCPCIQGRCGLLPPPQCCSWQRAGPVLSSHALRAISPTPPQQGMGPVLLHLCHQDQLYCAELARGGDISGQPLDINMIPGSNLDQATWPLVVTWATDMMTQTATAARS
jgi:hypothetical protein